MPIELYKFMMEDAAGEQLKWYCIYYKRDCAKLHPHIKQIEKQQVDQNVLKRK